MALKTDYKDDVLDTSVNEKRVYNLVDQSGNTVMSGLSLEDVTTYLQKGDEFGAQELNEITSKINEIETSVASKANSSDLSNYFLKTTAKSQVLTFTNKTVATSAWKSSSNEDFPYYADVSCSGVTTSYVPNVNFSLADANSGIFSTVCESVSGAVRIYASEKPTATVTIPTIQCIKSV